MDMSCNTCKVQINSMFDADDCDKEMSSPKMTGRTTFKCEDVLQSAILLCESLSQIYALRISKSVSE